MFPHFTLQLPGWIEAFIEDPERTYGTLEERMRLVIGLSKRNVEEGTGGPFGAAVFDLSTKRLMAPGVNLVLHLNCSVFHAEMVALILAQRICGNYDLGADTARPVELVASTEPCAMCLGAVPWAGVTRLACGARGDDARNIGFEEGPKPANWVQCLEERNIAVVRDVLREEACAVLRHYVASGGLIYNSRAQDLFCGRCPS